MRGRAAERQRGGVFLLSVLEVISAQDIREAFRHIDEIIGEVYPDEL